MSPLSVEPLHVALAVSVVALTCLWLLAQRFAKTGCPFAKPSSSASKAAGAQAMAAAAEPGSVRLTLAQLAGYDGSDPARPLYIAVRGKIYDVSAGRSFYGPGGPYAVFAGKECSRALALMRVTAEDCSDDLSGATEAQLATLADWEAKFVAKYGVAGSVAPA